MSSLLELSHTLGWSSRYGSTSLLAVEGATYYAAMGHSVVRCDAADADAHSQQEVAAFATDVTALSAHGGTDTLAIAHAPAAGPTVRGVPLAKTTSLTLMCSSPVESVVPQNCYHKWSVATSHHSP